MDIDQEVVREPFDENGDDDDQSDHRSVRHHSPDLAVTRDQTSADRACKKLKTEQADQTEQQLYHSNHDDSSSEEENSSTTSSCLEDAKFAETFGIRLKSKSKKSQLAYERLMKSSYTLEQQPTDKPKPTIKTSVTTDCIYHKGTFYQKGDIVALFDQEDGQTFFGQLTGFLQDQYCEKSASINWLVPIKPTSRDYFDPSAYRIGLEDMQLRKLDCMAFVRHCPHDYYLRKLYQSTTRDDASEASTSRQAINNNSNCQDGGHDLTFKRSRKDQAYIWTTMEPCRVPRMKTN